MNYQELKTFAKIWNKLHLMFPKLYKFYLSQDINSDCIDVLLNGTKYIGTIYNDDTEIEIIDVLARASYE